MRVGHHGRGIIPVAIEFMESPPSGGEVRQGGLSKDAEALRYRGGGSKDESPTAHSSATLQSLRSSSCASPERGAERGDGKSKAASAQSAASPTNIDGRPIPSARWAKSCPSTNLRQAGLKCQHSCRRRQSHPLGAYDANDEAQAAGRKSGREVGLASVAAASPRARRRHRERDRMRVQFTATDLDVQMRVKTVLDPVLLNSDKSFPRRPRPAREAA